MNESKNVKALKKQLAAAIAMVCVAAVALGSSTYAWFVNNTMVKTEAATLAAKTAYALLISEGATGSDTAWKTTHRMTNAQNLNMVPVSTTGKTSMSIGDNSVATPMTFVKQAHWSSNTATKASEVDQYAKTTANTEYLMENFEIKASQKCDLYLDQDTQFTTTTTNSTLGKTLRLALVVNKKGDTSSKKYYFYTIDTDETSGKTNTTFNGSTGADGIATAIKDGNKTGAEAVAGIDVDNLAVDSKVKKLVTATGVTGDALATEQQVGTADKLYTFTAPEEVCEVTAYIWMEGCDGDTVAANLTSLTGNTNQFKAVLGFCAK